MKKVLTTLVALSMLLSVGCKKDGEKKGDAEADKRAKAAKSEAEDNLDKLFRSASSYYTTPRVARTTGSKLDCQFPTTNDWTPTQPGMKTATGCSSDKKMWEVNTTEWTTMTWSALNFQINDRHFGQYRIESSGRLGDAKATLSARVDPDCDGKFTVYSIDIAGEPNASSAECTVAPRGKLKVTEQ